MIDKVKLYVYSCDKCGYRSEPVWFKEVALERKEDHELKGMPYRCIS